MVAIEFFNINIIIFNFHPPKKHSCSGLYLKYYYILSELDRKRYFLVFEIRFRIYYFSFGFRFRTVLFPIKQVREGHMIQRR